MQRDFFFHNNTSMRLEYYLQNCESFEDFEKKFPDDFLKEDRRVGNYLSSLLYKYDRKASVVSFDAHLNPSYVGNIINGKKNNPSRDALICICFALGATEEELQYLLKYAGHAPLYVRRKRDVIIWFGIMQRQSIETVNDTLLERGLKPLYRE